jgi:Phosphoglycerate dehydrogenase and related dehydrogenases
LLCRHCNASYGRKKLQEFYEITNNSKNLEKASAAIVYGVPEEWTSRVDINDIKVIGCHSYGQVVEKWAEAKAIKIVLDNSLWRTVAEHTLALCMTAARNISKADLDIRKGKWNNHVDLKVKYAGYDFQKKNMGIWGMGQIGKELAKLLKGFNMRVLYNDIIRLSEAEEYEMNITYCTFEELLQESDYFCVLIPLTDKTKGIMDKNAFIKMKSGCIFVNTARAGIVDKEAFFYALDNKIIASAALDVLWEEGMVQESKLLEYDNIIFTPHLGGSTFECDMVLVNGVIADLLQ